MERTNGILEDICAEIGYGATTALVAWFGNGNLYIPETVSEQHPIAKAIGVKPLQRLSAAWGGETLWVADCAAEARDRRDRAVAILLGQGKGAKDIAREVGLTERRVQQIRVRLEQTGLIPLVLTAHGITPAENAEETSGENAGGMTP